MIIKERVLISSANGQAVAKNCDGCQLLEASVLATQPEACVAEFSGLLTRYSINEKGRTVFNQGQPITHVYLLCKGLVKLSAVTPAGDEVVMDVLTPCSIVGTLPVKDDETHPCTATTLTATTELCLVKAKDLIAMIGSYPTLAVALARHLSTKLSQAYAMIVDMKLPVGERLISILARLAHLVGDASKTVPAKIPLSCKEIAQLAQTTPETLSRLLQPHQQRGIIRVEKGLWVLNKERLEELQEYFAENRERDERI